jgi:hypothetical protein
MTDLHTDGNRLAGVLTAFLAADVTTMQRRCQACHDEHAIAAHPAYPGAGDVLRCPGCGAVAVRVAERADEILLEWRGTYRVAVPSPG